MSMHDRLHRLFGPGPLFVCAYCRAGAPCYCIQPPLSAPYDRQRVFNEGRATLDHVFPKSRGGSNADSNLAVACARCNSAKNGRVFPDEWFPGADSSTYVLQADLPIVPGDGLVIRGLITVLAELDPGLRYTVAAVADYVGEATAFVRNRLIELVDASRLSRSVRPIDVETVRYELVFGPCSVDAAAAQGQEVCA